MRIGPFDIVKAAARPSTDELGSTGTSRVASGNNILLTEEDYNPDLRGQDFYNTIDRMRLSDSQVKAVMSIIKLPLLAADWSMDSPTDEEQDVQIAEWIEDQFFDHQLRTWDYILRHILLSLDFGVMPFETVWKVEDDKILHKPVVHLAKMAPRMPKSIVEWRLTEDGELGSILQQAEKGGQFRQIEIPGDRLLVFVHDMEGSNYKGTSVLRQARKDWFIKERLQRINQVAIEKRAAGIDVGTLPDSASKTQKDAFEAVLQTVRTHERSYVVEPQGHKYRIEGIGGSVIDPLPSIQYADLMILRSILADFLVSGTSGERGALAMVKDRSSFFLMALGAIANEIMAPINRDLIPKWVDWNWPNIEQYPQITHSRLDRRDVGAIAEALKALIPIGVVSPDEGIEDEVRELLEMPEAQREEGEALAQIAQYEGEQAVVNAFRKNRRSPRLHVHSEEKPAWLSKVGKNLVPRTPLEKSVDWVALERGLDDAENRIVEAYRNVQDRQISKLVEEGMKAITAEKSPDERAEMLENINVPYKREVTSSVTKTLVELFNMGQREVKQEMARQGGAPIRLAQPLDADNDKTIERFLRFRALAMVTALTNRLRGSLLTNGLNMIREGSEDRLMLEGALSTLSDRAIRSASRDGVTEAMNLGRESMAKRNENLVEQVVYSAILDKNVCSTCAPLDGTTYELGSRAYEEAKPPRPFGGPVEACLGRNRCRCTFIYKFRSEAPARG